MATLTSIFIPGQGSGGVSTLAAPYTASVNATTASAEIPIGNNQIFAISATGAFNVRFGPSGTSTASASDFQVGAGIISTWDTGDSWKSVVIFNPGASAITYWVMKLSKV